MQSGEQVVVRLSNPKNSCYANVGLNLLISVPPMVKFLRHCEVREGSGALVRELRRLMLLSPEQVII